VTLWVRPVNEFLQGELERTFDLFKIALSVTG
jgi:hypothetical protein